MKSCCDMRTLFLFLFSFYCLLTNAQNDSINKLEEILLKGNFSSKLSEGYFIVTISDSILKSTYQSLGSLLQNNSNLYFKQNGYGMVSSISLRGTGAARTGVYWNGIPINSSLNGQTDFNTLFANGLTMLSLEKVAVVFYWGVEQ